MNFAPLHVGTPTYNAIETVSGRYFDPVKPDPAQIDINDIAWALSRQARFAGHTIGEPYYVAQHCLLVDTIVDYVGSDDSTGAARKSHRWWLEDRGHNVSDVRINHVAMGALMHDASEAYLIDLPSPIKRHPDLRAPYKELENRVQAVIAEALELPELNEAELCSIEWADLVALQVEAVHLMPSRGRGWGNDLPQITFDDHALFEQPKKWRTVQTEFLARYDRIKTDLFLAR
jgi:hypothetical protein